MSPETPQRRAFTSSGSPVPFALAPDGSTCTTVFVPTDILLKCPGCRRVVIFDAALGRIGQFRHATPGPCPLDDPEDRIPFAKARVRAVLDALQDGSGASPWLVATCACGLDAFRDLRGAFARHEVGTPDDGADFFLIGANDKNVMTLFLRDDPDSIRYLHDAYPHRFIALDSYRALWHPGAWLLGKIRGITNYRDVSPPSCPLCANRSGATVSG